MQHPELARKRADYEFERRFNLVGLVVLLAAMPLLVFVVVAYVQSGYFSPLAMNAALLTYLIVVFASSALARRRIVTSLREKGLVSDDYRPPTI